MQISAYSRTKDEKQELSIRIKKHSENKSFAIFFHRTLPRWGVYLEKGKRTWLIRMCQSELEALCAAESALAALLGMHQIFELSEDFTEFKKMEVCTNITKCTVERVA